MRNLYYYFKDLTLKRGRYLFRQGDPINGVFCILSGEVKLVKEQWTMAEQENTEYVAPVTVKRRTYSRSSAKISNSYATDSSINVSSNGSLSLINELRRNAAKSVII